jgi:RimJ/RimL family protein N-acetyltransferase
MEFRPLNAQDAPAFSALVPQLDQQTEFMLIEPGERGRFGAAEARKKIIAESRNGVLIGAFTSTAHLIGYVSAQGSPLRRIKHVLYVVIGIIPEYAHRGVGTRLLSAVDNWARERDIHRLELTVIRENVAAIGLYTKHGFEIEGVRRQSTRIGNVAHDEFYMAKLLD